MVNMEPSYEIFDHTADMGMRVVAPTMSALLAPAANGLYAMIGEFATAGAEQTVDIKLTGDDPSIMLRDFLDELLVLFDRDKRIAVALDDVSLTADGLRVAVRTRAIDEDRCVFLREVKAITYHALDIVDVPGGFQATIIVDI